MPSIVHSLPVGTLSLALQPPINLSAFEGLADSIRDLISAIGSRISSAFREWADSASLSKKPIKARIQTDLNRGIPERGEMSVFMYDISYAFAKKCKCLNGNAQPSQKLKIMPQAIEDTLSAVNSVYGLLSDSDKNKVKIQCDKLKEKLERIEHVNLKNDSDAASEILDILVNLYYICEDKGGNDARVREGIIGLARLYKNAKVQISPETERYITHY